MLAMALPAMEGTIVSTAMPSIVSVLGGFESYSLVFSAFLLAQAVATPLFGSLADRHGRKSVLLAGTTVFLVGSVLCGFAGSMTALVLFRVLQGLGAAAIYPTVSTLASDLYPVADRGRSQATVASVWGIAAVAGPGLGGTIVQYTHWGWVFWFHLPLGVAAMIGVGLALHERRPGHPPARAGGLPLGLDLWRDPLVLLANVATFAAGMLMITLITYTPTYVQGLMGAPPTVAGYALTTMSIGWPLAGFVAGRLLVPLGPARTSRIGSVFLVAGSAMYVVLVPSMGPLWVTAASFLVGIGLGFVITTMIVSIQSSVPWERRGSATATNMLMRLAGNGLGAMALGALLNADLRRAVVALGDRADEAYARIATYLAPVRRATTDAAVPDGQGQLDGTLLGILGAGLHRNFVVMAVLSVVILGVTWMIPARRALDSEVPKERRSPP